MGKHFSPRIVTEGMVLCLDVGNRESYPGAGSSWLSLTSNDTAGLVNAPTYSSANLGYLTFNGSNQYCTSTRNITGRPFTLNAWFYFNSLTGYQTVIGQNSSVATKSSFWFQKITDGAPGGSRVSNTFSFNGIDGDCTDPTPVVAGVWYNYCASIDTSGTSLYKNGSLVATLAGTATMNAPSSMVFGVGYFNNGLADYTRINLSLVTTYNRALTAAEASQNFNALRGRYGI